MSHAGWAHASLGQPIVEPRGRAVAETGTKGLMNRAEHLKEHEDRAGKRERTDERIAVLHGTDQHAHRDGKCRRQDSSEQEGRPPGGGQAGVSLRQDTEELPFLALGQELEHDCILPQPARGRLRRGGVRTRTSGVLEYCARGEWGKSLGVVKIKNWKAQEAGLEMG